MGGSSKPADPKVTPFVEPAAPSNPIPNYFGQTPASGGMYKPDFGASKGAFGAPQPQQEAMEAPQTPWQAPQQPQTAPYSAPETGFGQQAMQRGFAIPTPQSPNMGGGLHDRLTQAMQGQFQGGGMFGGQGFDPQNFMQRLQANPNMFMDMIGKFRSGFQGAPRVRPDVDAFGQPVKPTRQPINYGAEPGMIAPDDWRA